MTPPVDPNDAVAERVAANAGLDNVVGTMAKRLVEAADADREARQQGVLAVVEQLSTSPLPWLVTMLSRSPLNTSCLSDSTGIRAMLTSGDSIAGTALRNALTASDRPVPDSAITRAAAKELAAELDLSVARAMTVADAFFGGYVVLTLLTLAERHFTREAIAESLPRLGDSPLAGFARGFWTP